MAKRLFTYPYDAEEEALSLKALLQKHAIDFYETPGNQWTFTRAAIWIKNNEDFSHAQELLEEHITTFSAAAREQYQAETGYNPHAPLRQRMHFLALHLYRKRALLPLFVLAGVLLYIYLRMFFGMFS
jgi:hypothetical protein